MLHAADDSGVWILLLPEWWFQPGSNERVVKWCTSRWKSLPILVKCLVIRVGAQFMVRTRIGHLAAVEVPDLAWGACGLPARPRI